MLVGNVNRNCFCLSIDGLIKQSGAPKACILGRLMVCKQFTTDIVLYSKNALIIDMRSRM